MGAKRLAIVVSLMFILFFAIAAAQSPDCITVEKNGHPDDKLDIVFIADNFHDMDLFRQRVYDAIDNTTLQYDISLTQIEPITLNRNKMNFYYVNKSNFLGCDGNCNSQDIMDIASACPYDKIFVLINATTNARSETSLFGRIAKIRLTVIEEQTSPKKNVTKWIPGVIPHEFGHMFAGLNDEYLYVDQSGQASYKEFPPSYIGNPDKNVGYADENSACQNWCFGPPVSTATLESYDCSQYTLFECANQSTIVLDSPCDFLASPNRCENMVAYCTQQTTKASCEYDPNKINYPAYAKQHCVWSDTIDPYFNSKCIPLIPKLNIGTACISGTGCYEGASYLGWYRPTYTSIMKGEAVADFGPVNTKIIQKYFDQYQDKIEINKTLYSGWNLISIPLNTTNDSVSNILKDIDYDALYGYNYTWYTPTELKDESYWLHTNQEQILSIRGFELNKTINLSKKFFANYYLNSKQIYDLNISNSTTILNYNTLTGRWLSYNPLNSLSTLSTLSPGTGYISITN